MIQILKTLALGSNARVEERVKDVFAIELIEQKIRESEIQLKAAKGSLASLIQRQRSEERLLDTLNRRIATMTTRATKAIEAEEEDLALEAAQAIATMENEAQLRQDTVSRLDAQVTRLRGSVEAGHRRLIDLKQGAITARAIKREQQIQGRLRTTLGSSSAADEAQELIARVIGRDDPFEQSQILAGIEADLDHSSLDNRMAELGFGPATKVTAQHILNRLKEN